MTIRWLRGDCRETLATLDAGSVQSAITSPPYFGLRSYNTPDLVWDGDPECRHIFGLTIPGNSRGGSGTPTDKNGRGEGYGRGVERGAFCPCGAWLGSLGLEPTPEQFVEHIVEVFRAVRRVLRDDGCIWVNMGDSYAGSGNGSNDHREGGASLSKHDLKYVGQKPGPQSLPAKNLLMMPARVAMALQADGWLLRSQIPWLKRNSMPESVTDRPATAVEYVYLLSKGPRYFYDADAVRVRTGSEMSWEDYESKRSAGTWPSGGLANYAGAHKHDGGQAHPNGRNRRNTDWFFESWQGLMSDEADEPIALVVNPMPFKGAHFATFPSKLVEPMVKASSRPGDTVLDPFAGAGTTLMVADRLGRNAIGCELSDSYSDLGTERIVGDSPMFTELTA